MRLATDRAAGTHTGITRRDQDGDSTGTKLREEVAGIGRVRKRDGGFIVTVGDGEGVGQRRIRKSKQIVQELDVGLIGIGSGAEKLTTASSAVVGIGNIGRDGTRVLDVQVGFDARGGVGTRPAVDDGTSKRLCLVGEVRVAVEEGGEVSLDGVFLEEASNAKKANRLHLCVCEIVQICEAGGCDARSAASSNGLNGGGAEFIFNRMVLGDGRPQLLETEEGSRLNHVHMALENRWQTVL